jgi:uroporphyrinogen-III synthase
VSDDASPVVAVFRPADERIDRAVDFLESLGATPVPDPMLAVDPTGATPADAPIVVFTSKTGVELAAEAGWNPGGRTLVAIGPATAEVAREAGWSVDVVPEEYTSAGLVSALRGRVEGEHVSVARSDHGSAVLVEGLADAGARVTETVLYRLQRPAAAGESAELAAAGDLDGLAFTSSLTVEHWRARGGGGRGDRRRRRRDRPADGSDGGRLWPHGRRRSRGRRLRGARDTGRRGRNRAGGRTGRGLTRTERSSESSIRRR